MRLGGGLLLLALLVQRARAGINCAAVATNPGLQPPCRAVNNFLNPTECERKGCCWIGNSCIRDFVVNTNCAIPFEYLGEPFFGCININFGTNYWCSTQAVYVDGFQACSTAQNWRAWGAFTCNANCVQERRRTCPIANSCFGSDTEVTNNVCTGGACPPPLEQWTQWSQFTCAATCVWTRTRTCLTPTGCQDTNIDASASSCTGGNCQTGQNQWNLWTGWSCPASCIWTRTRTCPAVGTCVGSNIDNSRGACTGGFCPGQNQWTLWTGWSCPASCIWTRTRTCPAVGTCVGSNIDNSRGACTGGFCPAQGLWGQWTTCSPCGGLQIRTRVCPTCATQQESRPCSVTNTINCPVCGKAADIIFMLDKSGSIMRSDINAMQTFSALVTQAFATGNANTRIGMMSFADNPDLGFYLGQYATATQALNAIAPFIRFGGTTFTNLAFDFVRTTMAITANGDRANVPTAAVLLTDGNPNDMQATSTAATQLKNAGVKVFVVTIGNNVNQINAQQFASTPISTYYLHSLDFSNLINHVTTQVDNICSTLDSWDPWGIWGACSEVCGGGSQTRTRNCRNPPCSGNGFQTQPCNSQACQWSMWSNVGTCSAACGGGTITRTRSCPRANMCSPGTNTDTQTCNTGPCNWGQWQPFGPCSASCGGGNRVRTRTCLVQGNCPGNSVETESCNNQPCFRCDGGDLVLVLDSSMAATSQGFEQLKTNVRNFIKGFDYTSNTPTRIGLTMTGTGPIALYLNSNGNEAQIDQIISTLAYRNTQSDFYSGLQSALNLFTTQFGNRANRPDTLVVFMLSRDNTVNAASLGVLANQARSNGIKVIAVGVGSNVVDQGQLISIANTQYVFNANTMANLPTQILSVHNRICTEWSEWGPWSGCSVTCGDGSESRSRQCPGGDNRCPGNTPTESQSCTMAPCDVCSGEDIVFLVDSGFSVGAANFNLIKNFILDVLKGLDPTTRVGVAVFGSNMVKFHLNRYSNRADLENAIGGIAFVGGSDDITSGINTVVDTMFTSPYGDRADRNNHLVVVTSSTFQSQTVASAADNARAEDVTIFAIGIGNAARLTEIANMPSSDYVMQSQTFTGLGSLSSQLSARLCREWGAWGAWGACSRTCGTGTRSRSRSCTSMDNRCPGDSQQSESCYERRCDLCDPEDVVFLIDSTSSLGQVNFNKIKAFVKEVITGFIIAPSNTHVGLVTSSKNTFQRTKIVLNQYSTLAALNTAIDNIQYDNELGAPDYMGGLDALDMMLQGSTRPNKRKFGIVIVSSQGSQMLDNKANDIRNKGVVLMAVGLGSQASISQVLAIGGSSSTIFTETNLDQLQTIRENLQDAVCNTWGAWGAWGTCSASCGSGKRNREKTCPSTRCQGSPPLDIGDCFMRRCTPCDGENVGLLLDNRQSVGALNFRKMVEFGSELFLDFEHGSSQTHIGVATLSQIVLSLAHYDTFTMQQLMSAIPYQATSFDIADGLGVLRSLFTGSRTNKINYGIVVVTAPSVRNLAPAVTALKQMGVRLIAIGVGSTVSRSQLETIAENSDHVFMQDDYDMLLRHRYDIADKICSTVCRDSFDATTGIQAVGGTERPSYTSVDACKNLCIQEGGCVGFDFDSQSTVQCFTFTDKAKFDKTSTNSRVTHYALTRCDGPGTPPPSTLPPIDDGCFDLSLKTGMEGGAAATQYRTLEACLSVCLEDDKCIAIDYTLIEAATRCWIHNTASNLYDNINANHYAKRATCGGTTDPGEPCYEYDRLPNTHSFHGIKNFAITLDSCMAICDTRSECVGLDWTYGEATQRTCHIHVDIGTFVDERKTDASGIDQYVRRVGQCGTGTPTGGCEDFKVTTNRQVIGGQGQGINRLDDCKIDCLADVTCFGFDWDKGKLECYQIFEKAKLIATTPNDKVDHYVKQDCVATSPPATPPTPICGDYQKMPDYFAHLGSSHPAETEDECLYACDETSECRSVDFDTRAGAYVRCFLHFQEAKIEPGLGVNHYEKDDTECECPRWRVHGDMASLNGKRQPASVDTDDLCKDACLANDACVGFDFDATNQPCWLLTNEDDRKKTQQPRSGVDQYELVERCNDTCPVWIDKTDLHANNGKHIDKKDTIAECKQSCVELATCKAIDFVAGSSQKCWHHYGTLTEGAMTGSVHSVLSERCPDSGTASTRPTTTSRPECPLRFSLQANYNANGATQTRDLDSYTEELCKDECFNNAECVALDYDTRNNECWLFTDIEKANKTQPRQGVNHWTIQEDCGTVTPDECEEVWEQEAGKRGFGAARNSASTVQSCQKACSDAKGPICSSIDWHPSASTKCWLHMGNKTVKLQTGPGIDHFTLVQRGCPEITTKPCIDYTRTEDSHYLGGEPADDGNGLDACKFLCSSEGACLGFDFNKGDGECFFFRDTSKLTNPQERIGVDHYRKVDICRTDPVTTTTSTTTKGTTTTPGCQEGWQTIVNRHTTGATEASGANTVQACQRRCLTDRLCTAIDYNRSPGARVRCWIHTTNDVRGRSQGAADTDQYLLTRCEDPCPIVFNPEQTNTERTGGHFREEASTSVDACKLECIETSDCVAIKYDRRNFRVSSCYIFFNSDPMGTFNNVRGVSYYTNYDSCDQRTVPVDLVFGLDESGSIEDFEKGSYRQILAFVIRVIGGLRHFRTGETRVGVVTFSTEARKRIFLDEFVGDFAGLTGGVNSMGDNYVGDYSNVAMCLNFTADLFQERGSRPGVPKKALIILDGESNKDAHLLQRNANRLKGIAEVFALGITDEITESTLNMIATSPSHIEMVDNFASLQMFEGFMDRLEAPIALP